MMRSLLIALGTALLLSTATQAQEASVHRPVSHALAGCPAAPGSAEPLPLSCVDRRPAVDSAASLYGLQRTVERMTSNRSLRGSFNAIFVIDTAGRPKRHTARVVAASPTDTFAQRYAYRIISELRYVPAFRDGRAVPVQYEQEVVYEHPGRYALDPQSPPLTLAVEMTPSAGGGRLAVRWMPVAYAPRPEPDSLLGREYQIRALLGVFEHLEADSLAFACVALQRHGQPSEPSAWELARLRESRERTVRRKECPPTYSGMVLRIDSLGNPILRPPGAGPDPHYLEVREVVPWTEDWVVVQVHTFRSGSGAVYRCMLHRRPEDEWDVTCESTSRWIS